MESSSVHGGSERRRLAFSPERCKLYTPQPARVIRPAAFKKVEIVYYLTKNGHLEHPHFMEITHVAHRQLRLRDFMDRLTVLRGKGMPLLYSWSCKRIYKNGYVWNDLAENDVIFPSEGDEYVLKGSELVLGCNEKMGNLETEIGPVQEMNFKPKRRFLPSNGRPKSQGSQCDYPAGEMAEEEYQEKTMYMRCSRNVSGIEEYKNHREIRPPAPPPPPPPSHKNNNSATELILDPNTFSASPPSTASSDNSNTAKRYEDGDPLGVEPMLSRNSMLLNLIACGGLGSFRKTTPPPPPPASEQSNSVARKSSSLHMLAMSNAAAAASTVRVLAEEDEDMINYMPGNPRFGNLQSQEKEYFSGSIVDAITTEERLVAEPRLKKSNSYNQEKSVDAGLGKVAGDEKEQGGNGKRHNWICIPRKNKSSFSFNHLDD